ncbi:hypothetical protein HLH36_15110 [Gluconacetobacter aggeris]|uniref:Uncharacterized protein n=1 Tax=Gluconacetobacter aggeris TaxID=1286186 RepID=A0A7W4IV59_9PROT|nr:hypothetical protein [Gluconacetobacter aggeris]MBB2169660.1 hypothetical protein [Gluconacetobacter aggeris]
MTNLHDQIQMLRAELTSYGISRRERAQIERELRRVEAEFVVRNSEVEARASPPA